MNVLNAEKRNAGRSLLRDLLLFGIGGVGYYSLEVVFRGYSHISMGICGGVCLLFIYRMNRRMRKKRLALRALGGASIITVIEFICGCIVNLWLGLRVWDYSHLPLNLFGQICLPFSVLWFFLCFPICAIFGKLCSKSPVQN